MELLVMRETSMAKLEVSPFQSDITSKQKLRVPVRSIDSIVAAGEAPPPQLIKIDVEGAELLVLEGALQTIRSHHPQIFVEVHSSGLLGQCAELLAREGYALEHIDTNRALASSADTFQICAFT